MFGIVYTLINTAFAQSGGSDITLENPLGASDVGTVIQNTINQLQIIAVPLVAIMVLVGAYQMLFSAGDEEKFKRGRKTIIYVVIGYAILLIAGGVTSLIHDVLSGTPPTSAPNLPALEP